MATKNNNPNLGFKERSIDFFDGVSKERFVERGAKLLPDGGILLQQLLHGFTVLTSSPGIGEITAHMVWVEPERGRGTVV